MQKTVSFTGGPGFGPLSSQALAGDPYPLTGSRCWMSVGWDDKSGPVCCVLFKIHLQLKAVKSLYLATLCKIRIEKSSNTLTPHPWHYLSPFQRIHLSFGHFRWTMEVATFGGVLKIKRICETVRKYIHDRCYKKQWACWTFPCGLRITVLQNADTLSFIYDSNTLTLIPAICGIHVEKWHPCWLSVSIVTLWLSLMTVTLLLLFMTISLQHQLSTVTRRHFWHNTDFLFWTWQSGFQFRQWYVLTVIRFDSDILVLCEWVHTALVVALRWQH